MSVREPRVRKDGRCARKECGKVRRMPPRFYVARAVYEADPFCSAKCCRRHYGVRTTTTMGMDEVEAEKFWKLEQRFEKDE